MNSNKMIYGNSSEFTQYNSFIDLINGMRRFNAIRYVLCCRYFAGDDYKIVSQIYIFEFLFYVYETSLVA